MYTPVMIKMHQLMLSAILLTSHVIYFYHFLFICPLAHAHTSLLQQSINGITQAFYGMIEY